MISFVALSLVKKHLPSNLNECKKCIRVPWKISSFFEEKVKDLLEFEWEGNLGCKICFYVVVLLLYDVFVLLNWWLHICLIWEGILILSLMDGLRKSCVEQLLFASFSKFCNFNGLLQNVISQVIIVVETQN